MSALRSILLVLSLMLAWGCGRQQQEAADDGVYYTCSMHPQVMEQRPGKCPICKMPLIAVRENTTQNTGELQLNELQIRLGNIRVDSARVRSLNEEVILPGRIVVDERAVSTISTRVMGRLETLHIRNIGERVAKGQPLYALYSEDLNVAVSEMLYARDMAGTSGNSMTDPGRLQSVARNKLLAYGLTGAQVDALSRLDAAPYSVEFLSPVEGVITELPAREGETLMQGAPMMKVASLSTVWAEAQVYPIDRSRIPHNAMGSVTLPALPDTVIEARVAFINPELDPSSVVGLVRLDLANDGGVLLPGMQANVHLAVSTVQALALPTDALIRDGDGASVWIAAGPGRFKVTMVSVGVEAGGYTEITGGIKEGDQVVVSGAYLLNSEYRFRQGSDPMAGMEM